MDLATLVVQGGTAGALVVVVYLFLKEIRKMREAFLNTIENHVGHQQQALEKNTVATNQVTTVLAEIKGWFERNGRA